ncbi:MAG: hypothetical protein VCB82_10240 [Alphaproteobacteria bacterium]|jgi:hypothetical protein|nr:MAG: hypothetical protein CFH36_00157 [Alphaproteobacteria bacterium MarineAlpha9_Bin6]PPR39209.1 MAG: hypothetical protein CFH35_00687 [Alphaproteobacteria bacterium MarineAlpha9_Bin5]HIO00691.1 hypothetical protein [Alphaproteobacteria bacterium]
MISAVTSVSLLVFLVLTVVLIGGAALLTGRALARAWRPIWQVVLSCLGLGLVDRFFVYALFEGSLVSVSGYMFDTLVVMGIGILSYRIVHVSVVVRQYPWLFDRSSLFSYRSRH